MSKKTIQINQEFLKTPSAFLGTNSGGNKTLKNRTHERKEKPQIVIKPNNIKKQLLQKIKNYQNKDENSVNNEIKLPLAEEADFIQSSQKNDLFDDSKKNEDEFESEFNKSLNFLQNLSSQKMNNPPQPKVKNKNKTLKNNKNKITNVATELPPELSINTPIMNVPIMNVPIMNVPIMNVPIMNVPIMNVPIMNNSLMERRKTQGPLVGPNEVGPNEIGPNEIGPNDAVLKLKEQPSYSNLKNGSKPTYRQIHNKTQKKTNEKMMESETIPQISFNTDSFEKFNLADIVVTPAPQQTIIEEQAVTEQQVTEPTVIRKKITRTLKYKLGKKGNKIAVLIRNGKTRKLIQHEQAILKSKSILDVKNYLRKKNLLKIGSDAPPDILRQIYENSILAGDIENKSKETLIHNYMHDK
jgi:hypothetical protein